VKVGAIENTKLLDDLPAIKKSDEQGIEKGVSEGQLGKGGK
jgi:hypothetical protein